MGRLVQFRRELVILWRAFMAPETPVWLKGLMLLVPAYLLSPIDFVPDFIPVLGWLDDIVVIPLLVSWIVSMLPQRAEVRPTYARRDQNGQIIDGDYRRL
jgi:uncharacterized membrane protein YkvA (DUF1232 family)